MPFPPAHPGLLRAIAARGYTEPTPVQAAVLDPAATGRDLLVSAQTGSGKTAAYGLAFAHTLLGDEPRFATAAPVLALVIAPTRELALQVQRELGWLYAETGARIVTCVGGMDIRREQRELQRGATIVVGTPGRLRDHLERGQLDLSQLAVVVLDEADEMLDLGFREDLEAILEGAPTERRTLLFSATLPRGIVSLAKQFQRSALRIATTNEAEPHGDIEYRAVTIVPRERDITVVNLLRYFEVRGALVFCATREGVNHLYANLLERGFSVVGLSGELSQNERTRALQALRDGRARVCVATDVAARGLDLPDLGLVIHADLPGNPEVLKHRSGRTGRAGRKGTAVLIVPTQARRHAERLLATARVQAEWSSPPSSEQIRARDQVRLIEEILAYASDASEEETAAAKAVLEQRTPEQIAAALVRMHRGQQPAPEELTPIGAEPARGARAPRTPRAKLGGGEPIWYRLDIGRTQNADPKWLIPLICDRGGVTKDAIGAIRIGPRETHVEIAGDAAAGFATALEQNAGKDRRNKNVRFALADGPPPAPSYAPRATRPPPRGTRA
ncbi:MAG: DEAD/DEAH box helicase, partial [Myxococcales bacterium]|nr:DEAD/DEAH box helicase [Myxococcales bacterium]